MKFVIKHEIRGRLHVHLIQKRMTFEEADTLQYYLSTNKYITSVKVYQRTCDVAVTYVGDRAEIIKAFQRFAYSKVDVPDERSCQTAYPLTPPGSQTALG